MNSKIKAVIDFVMCPFRGLASLCREGPGGQWMALFMVVAILCFSALILGVTVPFFRDETGVTYGVVVRKWYQPEHYQWTGKLFVIVPERWHVVIAGKGRDSRQHERDLVVSPEKFQLMEEKTTWKIE